MVSYPPQSSDPQDSNFGEPAARDNHENLHQLLLPFTTAPDRGVPDPLPILRRWSNEISTLLDELKTSKAPKELAAAKIAELITTLFHDPAELGVTRAYRLLIPRENDARARHGELMNLAHISGWSNEAADFTTPCSLEETLSIGAALLIDLRAAASSKADVEADPLVKFVHRWSTHHGKSRADGALFTREQILIEEGLLRIVSLFAPHTGDTSALLSALDSPADERIFDAALDGIGRFGRQTQNSTLPHIIQARQELAEALVTAAHAREPTNRKINATQSFDFKRLWYTLSFLSPEALRHVEKFLADVDKDPFLYPSWAICAVLKCTEKLSSLLTPAAEQRYLLVNNPDSATTKDPTLETQTILHIEALLSYRRDSVRAFALGFLFQLCPQTLDNPSSRVAKKLTSLATQGDDIEKTERLALLVIITGAELRKELALNPRADVDANDLAERVSARWSDAPTALRTFAQYARTLPEFLAPLWPVWVKR